MKRPIIAIALLVTLAGCASWDISAAHLRNTVPRFTTFTTISPSEMASCIDKHWAISGTYPLTRSQVDDGFALQTSQKLQADSSKVPMMYIEVNPSREGSSVRFYTNRADEVADRSMISIIQRCH